MIGNGGEEAGIEQESGIIGLGEARRVCGDSSWVSWEGEVERVISSLGLWLGEVMACRSGDGRVLGDNGAENGGGILSENPLDRL